MKIIESLISLVLFVFIFFIIDNLLAEFPNNKPKFKVGDCIQYIKPNKEKWEAEFSPEKIIEIGKKSYRMAFISGNQWITCSYCSVDFFNQSFYKKVQCPGE